MPDAILVHVPFFPALEFLRTLRPWEDGARLYLITFDHERHGTLTAFAYTADLGPLIFPEGGTV